MIGLIGRKKGMTRLFGQDGDSVPVTVILAEPCQIVQVKTNEKEGYQAVQLGAFDQRKKRVRKPQLGHFAKAGVEPKAKLAEFRINNVDQYQPGQQLRVDIFQEGDRVKVTGTSKGKGFAGTVKRWGFKGGPKSHGQSDRHRAPGSIGGASWPARVWKGMKMSGRMGNERITIRNLEVVKVDLENNLLLVKGAVPGARNSYVMIQRLTELMAMPAAPEGQEEDKGEKEAEGKTKKEAAAAAAAVVPEAPKKKTADEKPADEPKTAAAEKQKASGEEQPEQEVSPAESDQGEPPEVGEKTAEEETPEPKANGEEIPAESKDEPEKASAEEGQLEEKDAASLEEMTEEEEASPDKKSTEEKKE